MKTKRKIIEIDEQRCTGCGQCVPACAEGAIELVDGKARLISDIYCDGLGACLGECPFDALKITEREADEFDERAVEEHLKSTALREGEDAGRRAYGCPSATAQSFTNSSYRNDSVKKASREHNQESALTHWPVQIRLVPPTAPFLKGAELLVAADCTPVAYQRFHEDFITGKVVMIGCPKFDDTEFYIQKFADIFRNAEIKRVTVAVMEVPCCQGLPVVVRKAMELAGVKVPVEKVVISARGEIIHRNQAVNE